MGTDLIATEHADCGVLSVYITGINYFMPGKNSVCF